MGKDYSDPIMGEVLLPSIRGSSKRRKNYKRIQKLQGRKMSENEERNGVNYAIFIARQIVLGNRKA